MPSLLGTIVTANYVKTKPKTLFGTRQLRFLTITASGGSHLVDFTKQMSATPTASQFTDTVNYATTNEYDASNSYFSAAVRAVQSMAEVYAIGTPSPRSFTVAIADQTVNDSGTTNNVEDQSYGDLATAITDAVKGVDIASGNTTTTVDSTITITSSAMIGNTLQTVTPITSISVSGTTATVSFSYAVSANPFSVGSTVGGTVNILGFSKPGLYTSTSTNDYTAYNGSFTVNAVSGSGGNWAIQVTVPAGSPSLSSGTNFSGVVAIYPASNA